MRLRKWNNGQVKKSLHSNTPSAREMKEMLAEKQKKWTQPQTVADFMLDKTVKKKEYHPYLRVLPYIFRFHGLGISPYVNQECISPKDMTPFDSDNPGFTLMDALLLYHRTKKNIYISSEDLTASLKCIFAA